MSRTFTSAVFRPFITFAPCGAFCGRDRTKRRAISSRFVESVLYREFFLAVAGDAPKRQETRAVRTSSGAAYYERNWSFILPQQVLSSSADLIHQSNSVLSHQLQEVLGAHCPKNNSHSAHFLHLQSI